jgi:hypothetical protein
LRQMKKGAAQSRADFFSRMTHDKNEICSTNTLLVAISHLPDL